MAAGTHEGRLDLYTTDPKYGHLQAPFVLVKKSADQISYSPREVEISGPAGRPLPSRVIVLRTSSSVKMEIDSITADDPAITARWAANAEGVIAVRVQIDHARLLQGSFDKAIHIHLTRPQSQTITVPVHFKQED